MLNTFYSVQINAISGPANSDGFIDPVRIQDYMVSGAAPTTKDQSVTKERANSRFDMLVQNLSIAGNLYVNNATATGANAITAPTRLDFTVEVERGDSVLSTKDENNAGQTLTGAAAIKRYVARSLISRRDSDFAEYYDPTKNDAVVANGATVSASRMGNRIDKIVVGALANTIAEAEAVITVTKINV